MFKKTGAKIFWESIFVFFGNQFLFYGFTWKAPKRYERKAQEVFLRTDQKICEHKARKILRTEGESRSMLRECIRGFFNKAYLLCRVSPPPPETSTLRLIYIIFGCLGFIKDLLCS